MRSRVVLWGRALFRDLAVEAGRVFPAAILLMILAVALNALDGNV